MCIRDRARGLWHAAGVLVDAVLPKQEASGLARVFSPKAHGGWSLDAALAASAPDAVLLFSSVAALLGGAGQANYAAANAWLDARKRARRAHGGVAASVQWGAWAEVGMAARGAASERMAAMEAASGFGRLGLAQGLGALHAAVLARGPSVIGVMPVQWRRMLEGSVAPAFLSGMARHDLWPVSSVHFVQRLACAVSLEAVLELVRRTAGGAIDADAPLMESGVDSLGAVELRNQLQRATGEHVALSSTLMFDHPTARQMALHLTGSAPLALSTALGDARASDSSPVAIAGLSVALSDGASSAAALLALSLSLIHISEPTRPY